MAALKSTKQKLNRYSQIIERLFISNYKEGMREVNFTRQEIETIAAKLKIKLPKNLGDIIYSFRYRTSLPESIKKKAPAGEGWIIRPAGRGLYRFVCTKIWNITPSPIMSETKVPDSTPGIVTMYSFDDEQALLAKLRYNRLIDIFTGVTCYSLQNHLRTTVPNMGQVETDEVYVGVDNNGVHYVMPVQAKGGTDKHNIVQIEQDFALCAVKFPDLICKAIGAQFMEDNLIALFEFESNNNEVTLLSEKHYRLVPPEEMTKTDLELYRERVGVTNLKR